MENIGINIDFGVKFLMAVQGNINDHERVCVLAMLTAPYSTQLKSTSCMRLWFSSLQPTGCKSYNKQLTYLLTLFQAAGVRA